MYSFGEDAPKKKKKEKSKYNYKFGDKHPGCRLGHKHKCMPDKCYVPQNMGWQWDIPEPENSGLKDRHNWRPGAVGKKIAGMMNFKVIKSKEKDKHKKKKKKGAMPDVDQEESEIDEPIEPQPTLKVQRKGDMITIEVKPLKDLTEIAENEDPYVNCDPLVFKLLKKRSPEEKAKVEARKLAKLKKQRDADIRKALAEATEDICKCAYMDVFCNDLKAIDAVIASCPAFQEPECNCEDESLSSVSSNATWDIEYTPPFGCFDLTPKKKKLFIHVETQYDPTDAGKVIENVKRKNNLEADESQQKAKKFKSCHCR